MRSARVAIFSAVVLIVACGGTSPPSANDIGEINAAVSRITRTCEDRSSEVSELKARQPDVDTLVRQFKDSPDDKFQRQPGAEPTTMRKVLRSTVKFANDNGCSILVPKMRDALK